MKSAIVVGAGVVGASVAYRLSLAGVGVTVVDAGEPGHETSSRSFAWLNANQKPPIPYHRLNAEGVEAHRRLAEQLGRAPWLHESGQITFTRDEAGARRLVDRVEQLRRDGYAAELIDSVRATQLEPRVRFEGATQIAYFPREGWAHGPMLVTVLLAAAGERGARVVTHRRVVGIEADERGARVMVVPTPAGRHGWPRQAAGASPAADETGTGPAEQMAADAIVVAAGRFSDRIVALIGFRLPLTPSCGLLAVTSPLDAPPERVVYAPGVHFRPDGDGRLVLQDDETDDTVTPDSPEDPRHLPGCALLLERAREIVPGLAGATVEAARVGIRPMPADGFPVVGRLPDAERVYLAVTHSGMTLAPLVGEIAAAELAGGALDPRLADFRPHRFLAAAR